MSDDGLRGRVLRGVGWKLATQVVGQGSRMVVAIVLARLLAPHDYGLAGMVLVLSSLVLVFSDLALGAALVQKEELTEEDRSTVFWTSVGFGAFFSIAGAALSGPVAWFYGEPAVKPLVAAFSLSFLVTALGTTQTALMTREMRFRSLELRQMGATLAGAAVGIAMAVRGYGAWAIIVQQLAFATVSTMLLWRLSGWRPRFVFSVASLRELGGFGGNVFGTRFLFYLNRNSDNILIGRFLGPAAVGAYAAAYNLILIPLSRLGVPLQEVLFPALSRLQHDRARVAAVWFRANRLMAAVCVPAMLGLAVVADDFVQVVLGGRWSAAAPVIQVLAWVGVLQSVQTLNEDVLQSLDRAGTMLAFMAAWSAASVTAVVVGLQFGVVGVAVCFAGANTLLTPLTTWLTARAAGASVRAFAVNLAPVFAASGLTAAAVLVARLALVEASVGAAPRLALCVALGVAVYAPLAARLLPDALQELRGLRSRRPAPTAAPPAATALAATSQPNG